MPSSSPPVLILGAARSGTKVLRRLLGAAPETAVVPYGVPAVWKRGNEAHPHDALPRSACSNAIAADIRQELTRLADGGPRATTLLEKTSANTLRVPFVDAVVPRARFVHLVRNGIDVAESARRRWQARPGLSYLIRKALTLRDTGLRQGLRYLWDTLRSTGSSTPRLWGPHYPGMAEDVKSHPLLHVCARQWRACVLASLDALATLPAERVLHLRYETLVREPASVDRLADFADVSAEALHAFYDETIRDTSVGRGHRRLAPAEQKALRPLVDDVHDRLDNVSVG